MDEFIFGGRYCIPYGVQQNVYSDYHEPDFNISGDFKDGVNVLWHYAALASPTDFLHTNFMPLVQIKGIL